MYGICKHQYRHLFIYFLFLYLFKIFLLFCLLKTCSPFFCLQCKQFLYFPLLFRLEQKKYKLKRRIHYAKKTKKNNRNFGVKNWCRIRGKQLARIRSVFRAKIHHPNLWENLWSRYRALVFTSINIIIFANLFVTKILNQAVTVFYKQPTEKRHMPFAFYLLTNLWYYYITISQAHTKHLCNGHNSFLLI